MSDDKFDPSEFAPDSAPTVIDEDGDLRAKLDAAAPRDLFVEPHTDKHRLERSAEYMAGLEVGRAEGYARGLADGRADIRAEDERAGREKGYDDFRRALIASGTPPAVAMIEMGKLREWALRFPESASEVATSGAKSAR